MKLQPQPKQQTNFLTCPGVKELPASSNKTEVRRETREVRNHGDENKNQLHQQAPIPDKGEFGKGEGSEEVLDSVTRLQQNDVPSKTRAHASSTSKGADGFLSQGSKSVPPVHSPIATTKRSPRKHRRGWMIFVLAILAVLALALPAVIGLTRAALAAEDAKGAMKDMSTHLTNRDLDAASVDLDRASQDITTVHDALYATGFWQEVPWVGPQIKALESVADAGSQAVLAGKSLVSVARSVFGGAQNAQSALSDIVSPVDSSISFMDMSAEDKRALIARLDRAIPDLKDAQVKIDLATDAWNHVPQQALPSSVRAAIAPIADVLPRLKQSIDEALPLLETFVPLAGYPKPANYLIVLQNSDELRATGGFLGTLGTMRVDAGNISNFSFEDVYALDNPASGKWKEIPPAPIKDRLGVPAWYFRDSNWSPDFPTSAKTMIDFYTREIEQGTGKAPAIPDNVLAFTPPVFANLLKLVGPITIDGKTYDANSYLDLLEYQVEWGFLVQGIPRDNRKDTLVKLGDELFARLAKLPASRWPDLLDLVTKSLDQKQILVYAQDPDTLARLDQFNWTGRVLPSDGDYLWVIDSNLAALKTDGVVDKHLSYQLDASDPSHPTATVTLHYVNNAPGYAIQNEKDFKYTRYRSYTRIYVPDGATLIHSNGAMKDDRYHTGGRFVAGTVDVYHELGKTVFGAFWSIEPQTNQDLTFTYSLPPSAVSSLGQGTYMLEWQKQPGNDKSTLTVDALFGKKVGSAVPPEDSTQWGDASYRIESDSRIDRQFNVKLQQ